MRQAYHLLPVPFSLTSSWFLSDIYPHSPTTPPIPLYVLFILKSMVRQNMNTAAHCCFYLLFLALFLFGTFCMCFWAACFACTHTCWADMGQDLGVYMDKTLDMHENMGKFACFEKNIILRVDDKEGKTWHVTDEGEGLHCPRLPAFSLHTFSAAPSTFLLPSLRPLPVSSFSHTPLLYLSLSLITHLPHILSCMHKHIHICIYHDMHGMRQDIAGWLS